MQTREKDCGGTRPKGAGSLPGRGQWLPWVSCNSRPLKQMAAWIGRGHTLLFYSPVCRAPSGDSHQKTVPFDGASCLVKCRGTAPTALPCGCQRLPFHQLKPGRQLDTNPRLCSVENKVSVSAPPGEMWSQLKAIVSVRKGHLKAGESVLTSGPGFPIFGNPQTDDRDRDETTHRPRGNKPGPVEFCPVRMARAALPQAWVLLGSTKLKAIPLCSHLQTTGDQG